MNPNNHRAERCASIVNYTAQFQKENGYSPSIRQIGNGTGIGSTSLVTYYLDILEDHGIIKRDLHTSRSIVILMPVEAQS